MALVGGGGAGNVAGSNPAGLGTLNFIGKHAYAYSGPITDGSGTGSASITVLEFDMPSNAYVVAKLNWISSLSGNSGRFISIEQNSQKIYDGRYDDVAPANTNYIDSILFEPSSHYVVKWGSNTGEIVTLTLVGEVY